MIIRLLLCAGSDVHPLPLDWSQPGDICPGYTVDRARSLCTGWVCSPPLSRSCSKPHGKTFRKTQVTRNLKLH